MRVDLGLEPVRCFLLSTRAARGIARTLVPSKAKALESDAQHPKFSLALQGVAGTQEPLDNIVILGTGHDVVAWWGISRLLSLPAGSPRARFPLPATQQRHVAEL